MRINYQSDFKIIEKNLNGNVNTPFRFTYFNPFKGKFIASFDGHEYVGCSRMEDGNLLVAFDNPCFSPGMLKVKREYFISDSDFKDGICNLVSVEDTGIVLGQAIAQALGDKAGIKRYGYFVLPMDEVLALGAVDLSGRPYLNFQADFTVPVLGTMDTEMVREFFYAVSYSAAMNLHLKILDAGNNHHMAEALFKAFGKALDMAVSEEPRIKEVWSTKGSL